MKRTTPQTIQATGFGDATAWHNENPAGSTREYSNAGIAIADEICEFPFERVEYLRGWRDAAEQYHFFSEPFESVTVFHAEYPSGAGYQCFDEESLVNRVAIDLGTYDLTIDDVDFAGSEELYTEVPISEEKIAEIKSRIVQMREAQCI